METDVTIWLESQSIRHSLRPWVVTSQREVFSNLHFQLSKVTFLASTHLRNPYISKKIPSQCRCQVHTLDSSNLSSLTSTPTILGLDTSPQQTDLKKEMIDKYCPRSEIKKLEVELWNLKVKGTDVLGYNQRFQELALLCVRMFSEESDKIEKYVGGLPDMIHESVMASRPKTMQDAIEMATELMDKKISTLAERQQMRIEGKLDNNNQAQQQSPKRQNVAQAYAAGTGKRKEYAGTLPLCNWCKLHHDGPWHYRSDCPKLKNQNHGNQAKGTGARGMVYAFGGGETEQDINNIEDAIEA
ncbi:reverse transcriptase domain-containing protein [Tanacetum coccineum]